MEPLQSQALTHWTVIDSVWPTSEDTVNNLQFLKKLGCHQETADIFGLPTKDEYCSNGVFIASNLAWRPAEKRMAEVASFPDQSYGAYYELLLPVLRAKAPSAHIVFLARRNDGVHNHLMEKNGAVLVQPLRPTLDHTPMQCVPSSDPGAATQNVAHGGGQIAIVSVAPDSFLPLESTSAEGFDLVALLARVDGFVCFLGEGDCRLAVQCANKMIPCEVSASKRLRASESGPAIPYELWFQSYASVVAALKSNGPKYEAHEQLEFYAAAYWTVLQNVNINSRCECGRVVAPEAAKCCCRTCERHGSDHHGPVCNARAEALRVLMNTNSGSSSAPLQEELP